MSKPTAVEQIMEFLKGKTASTKFAIGEGTGVKGLQLFNAIKKMTNDGSLLTDGDGDGTTYTLIDKPEGNEEKPNDGNEEELDLGQPTTRDNSKYKFNGAEYGKGPLVLAVVRQHVADNPKITLKALKEAFPDELLKRFGVFQEIGAAKKLSDARPRYFMKDEQILKIKDATAAVSNQWSAATIPPFLKAAKALGYKIK